jgi:hypothetical protein
MLVASVNLLATARSIILDIKLKFEMGRKELRSCRLRLGFLSLADTVACFCVDDRQLVRNEALQSRAITGAS